MNNRSSTEINSNNNKQLPLGSSNNSNSNSDSTAQIEWLTETERACGQRASETSAATTGNKIY